MRHGRFLVLALVPALVVVAPSTGTERRDVAAAATSDDCPGQPVDRPFPGRYTGALEGSWVYSGIRVANQTENGNTTATGELVVDVTASTITGQGTVTTHKSSVMTIPTPGLQPVDHVADGTATFDAGAPGPTTSQSTASYHVTGSSSSTSSFGDFISRPFDWSPSAPLTIVLTSARCQQAEARVDGMQAFEGPSEAAIVGGAAEGTQLFATLEPDAETKAAYEQAMSAVDDRIAQAKAQPDREQVVAAFATLVRDLVAEANADPSKTCFLDVAAREARATIEQMLGDAANDVKRIAADSGPVIRRFGAFRTEVRGYFRLVRRHYEVGLILGCVVDLDDVPGFAKVLEAMERVYDQLVKAGHLSQAVELGRQVELLGGRAPVDAIVSQVKQQADRARRDMQEQWPDATQAQREQLANEAVAAERMSAVLGATSGTPALDWALSHGMGQVTGAGAPVG